jgi:hypothetical protein
VTTLRSFPIPRPAAQNFRADVDLHHQAGGGYFINAGKEMPSTYDHRLRGTGHPVRSGVLKPLIGRLVVEPVTISEYLLLYVFYVFDRGINIYANFFLQGR